MSTNAPRPVTPDSPPAVYDQALRIADALDLRELDLYACTVRACLDAADTAARHEHLQVEMTRLSELAAIRRGAPAADIAAVLRHLRTVTGIAANPYQPLYAAMRDLVDHLELAGAGRWLRRLRLVMHEPDLPAALTIRRLATLLGAMSPGALGLPLGSANRVQAVAQRLPRHDDHARSIRYLQFATRAPQPSRRRPARADHVGIASFR